MSYNKSCPYSFVGRTGKITKMLHLASDDHQAIMYATIVLWTSAIAAIVLIRVLYCKHLLQPYELESTTVRDPPHANTTHT